MSDRDFSQSLMRYQKRHRHSFNDQGFASKATQMNRQKSGRSGSSLRSKGLLLAAIFLFFAGILVGFPIGQFTSLEKDLIRYPDKEKDKETLSFRNNVEKPSIAAVQQTSANVAQTEGLYIIKVGEYSPQQLAVIKTSLASLFPASELHSCENLLQNQSASPIIVTGDPSLEKRQIYLGCFDKIAPAKQALAKIQVLFTGAKIFQLGN